MSTHHLHCQMLTSLPFFVPFFKLPFHLFSFVVDICQVNRDKHQVNINLSLYEQLVEDSDQRLDSSLSQDCVVQLNMRLHLFAKHSIVYRTFT